MHMGFITIIVQGITVIVTKNIISIVVTIIINTMIGIIRMKNITVGTAIINTMVVITDKRSTLDHASILLVLGIGTTDSVIVIATDAGDYYSFILLTDTHQKHYNSVYAKFKWRFTPPVSFMKREYNNKIPVSKTCVKKR